MKEEINLIFLPFLFYLVLIIYRVCIKLKKFHQENYSYLQNTLYNRTKIQNIIQKYYVKDPWSVLAVENSEPDIIICRTLCYLLPIVFNILFLISFGFIWILYEIEKQQDSLVKEEKQHWVFKFLILFGILPFLNAYNFYYWFLNDKKHHFFPKINNIVDEWIQDSTFNPKKDNLTDIWDLDTLNTLERNTVYKYYKTFTSLFVTSKELQVELISFGPLYLSLIFYWIRVVLFVMDQQMANFFFHFSGFLPIGILSFLYALWCNDFFEDLKFPSFILIRSYILNTIFIFLIYDDFSVLEQILCIFISAILENIGLQLGLSWKIKRN